jgi:acetyltransferase
VKTEKPDNLPESLDPSKYREYWIARDGRAVILRAITSEDKQIEKELIDGLSLQSSRYRFFHVVKEATEEMVNRYCDIDYEHEIAIMAEYNSDDKKSNVGVIRLCIDPGTKTGEFAILVADHFQDSGLGWKFMEILIYIGRQKGLKSVYGTVLADNYKMLALAKEFGFSIRPSSWGEIRITRQL